MTALEIIFAAASILIGSALVVAFAGIIGLNLYLLSVGLS